jgi:hypothetical protein
MVEGGRVLRLRLDSIEGFDSSVDSIIDRLVETLDHGSAGGAFFPNNPDPRCMNQLSHNYLRFWKG